MSRLAVGARPRVLIAGGGFAAVETILALRALAGDRVDIDVVSLDRRLTYRAAATAQAFDDSATVAYDSARITADLGATHRVDRLEAVAPAAGTVRLASGAHLAYDELVLAVGARSRAAIPGAVTFAGPRDAERIGELLDALVSGAARSVIFAVPSGVTWPLPLYELALLTAGFARERGLEEVEIAIVTPEREPLDVFGARASELVYDVLCERGVRFLGGRRPWQFDRDGRLALQFGGGALHAVRVIAAPTMVGRPIAGIPASWHGFVPTDGAGGVAGLEGVYAAGDMTTFPVKHGGLATQQADAIAADIAAGLGLAPDPPAPERILRARLIGGVEAVELCATLDASGRAVEARLDRASPARTGGQDAPAAKVFGRYLAPYLAARGPVETAI